MHHGRCVCGAVAFHFDSEIGDFSACHCSICRRLSGTFWAGFHVPKDRLRFDSDRGLKWYHSSDWAQRGFCGECGASLFYQLNEGPDYIVAPGCLEGPIGRKLSHHICVSSKGDYYDLADGLPQFEEFPPK